jgi:catechol 2,3-dioxygenase-like lactoylglutathione lyase family enzyme
MGVRPSWQYSAIMADALPRIMRVMRTSPRLVPELVVSDLANSLSFYRGLLGFRTAYERQERRFAYLEKEGAELMLQQPVGRSFVNGDLAQPYGRGINLQIEVSDIAALVASVRAAGFPLFLELEDRWYRKDDVEVGNRQFVIADPDGYLLRFLQDLGSRPAGEVTSDLEP